jgi:hypothetical protein
MGNCNFKDKKEDGNNTDEGLIIFTLEKLSKASFNFQYTIGRGGFGKVTYSL